MSLSRPRTNLIAIMNGLDYNLIKDAFDFQNVGSTKLKKAYHVEQGVISAESTDQNTVTFSNAQTIRYWEKTGRNTSDMMTDCLTSLDTILAEIMSIANRVDGVVNVEIDQFEAVPHSDDNDNIIRGEISLSITQICAF